MTITSHLGLNGARSGYYLPDAALVQLAVIIVGDGQGGLLRDVLKRAVRLDLGGRAQGNHVELQLVLIECLVREGGKRCIVDEFQAPLPLVDVRVAVDLDVVRGGNLHVFSRDGHLARAVDRHPGAVAVVDCAILVELDGRAAAGDLGALPAVMS